jgi:hypothetical protein
VSTWLQWALQLACPGMKSCAGPAARQKCACRPARGELGREPRAGGRRSACADKTSCSTREALLRIGPGVDAIATGKRHLQAEWWLWWTDCGPAPLSVPQTCPASSRCFSPARPRGACPRRCLCQPLEVRAGAPSSQAPPTWHLEWAMQPPNGGHWTELVPRCFSFRILANVLRSPLFAASFA